jgi:hypothetical protein
MIIEPNWAGMFQYAQSIVEREIPENKGRDVVVEMLKYGARLYEVSGDEVVSWMTGMIGLGRTTPQPTARRLYTPLLID